MKHFWILFTMFMFWALDWIDGIILILLLVIYGAFLLYSRLVK